MRHRKVQNLDKRMEAAAGWLVEDAADNQLFSSPALDYVKTEMKKGI